MIMGPTGMKRRYKRLLQGALLGVGAPLGWLALSRLAGFWWQESFGDYQAWVLTYMFVGTSIAFSIFGYVIGRQEDRYAAMSYIDSLTRLHNTRYFHAALRTEFANAKRYNNDMSLLLLDLDHFKQVNDTHGHQAGDEVLRYVASVVKDAVREGDTVARVGGEEFAVILPATLTLGARELAERIRKAIKAHPVHLSDKQKVIVRASLGVAGTDIVDAKRPTDLFAVVDNALYAAKEGGRDQVAVAGPKGFLYESE